MPFKPDPIYQTEGGFQPSETPSMATTAPQKPSIWSRLKKGAEWTVGKVGGLTGFDVPGKIFGTGAFRLSKTGRELEQRVSSGQAGPEELQAYSEIYGEDLPTMKQIPGAAIKQFATLAPWGKAGAAAVETVLPATLAKGGIGTLAKWGLSGAWGAGTYGLGQSIVEGKTPIETAKTVRTYARAGAVLSIVGSYVISRIPKLLGIFSGEQPGTITEALKNPQAADLGISQGDDALRAVVKEGSEKSVQLRNSFIAGERQAVGTLAQQPNAGVSFNKKTIIDSFKSLLKSKDVGISKKGLDFTTSKIQSNPGEVVKINNAWDSLSKWDDWSFEGVHKLKQLVGGLTKFPTEVGGYSKSPTLGTFYHVLDTTIKDTLPKDISTVYSEINQNFSQHIDLFDEMVDAFNSGDPFSRLANALGRNKDSLRQVIQFYEQQTGKAVLPTIAGRELGMEKGAGGIAGPGFGLRNWFDLIFPPQLQARMITGTGRLEKFAPKQVGTIVQQQLIKSFMPRKQTP